MKAAEAVCGIDRVARPTEAAVTPKANGDAFGTLVFAAIICRLSRAYTMTRGT